MKNRVRVGRSATGLGLFACGEIRRGERIIEYVGRRVPEAEAAVMTGRYVFIVNSRWSIDGAPRWNVARYANHACRPNTEVRISRRGRIWFYARRRIRPGEEVTIHYGTEYFEAFITKEHCRCRTCRPAFGTLPSRRSRPATFPRASRKRRTDNGS